ncbi:hypothetical protein [Parvibaculum sp.]|uniref:hypothetical protein n=1 Tax=Parvibaculum sp. TaxID=2024848 RepID=UPI002B817DED|nr:hypothetical protein [Parvibaculum sp.]HUD52264.1 hypothetical protein [Parvibaculum sp.]
MRLFLSILLVGATTAAPAPAAPLSLPASSERGTCELVCETRQADGTWSATRACTESVTEKECRAQADHRNLSDAYPNRMKCKAALSTNCMEARK